MPVNPIDLQVIFSHMNQVSKQEALAKESEVMRQDQAALLVNKEGTKDAEDIPLSKDLSEGSGKIKDKEKGDNPRNKNQTKEDEDNMKMKKEEADDLEKIKDPDLGQNIDIVG